MNDDDPNSCVICLEPLASGAMGACVPCGHCFHQECFQSWSANQRRGRKSVKCPMCNSSSSKFIKLFLDLQNLEPVQDDDDDSLDSDEGDEKSTHSEEAQKVSQINEPNNEEQPENAHEMNHPENPDGMAEIIVIDDDDDLRAKVPPKPSDLNEKKDKYKRMAKKFKRRNVALESERNRNRDELKEVKTQNDNLVKQNANLKTDVNKYKANLECEQRNYQGCSLRLTEEMKLRTKVQQDYMQLSQQHSRLLSINEQLSKEKDAQVEKARKSNLVEVSQALHENPILKQENQKLKARVRQLEQKYQPSGNTKDSTAVLESSKPPPPKRSTTHQFLQNLDALKPSSQTLSSKRKNPYAKSEKKSTDHTIRIARAAKAQRSEPVDPNALLGIPPNPLIIAGEPFIPRTSFLRDSSTKRKTFINRQTEAQDGKRNRPSTLLQNRTNTYSF